MLLIPIAAKSILKNPPVITICLIVVNCLVFFFIQSGDVSKEMAAQEFYFRSNLAEIELPLYIRHLNESGKSPDRIPELKRLKQEKILQLYQLMMFDKQFLDKLHRDEAVTPGTTAYTEWKSLREEFERHLSKIVWLTYGFKPGNPTVLTMFSSMFLHGSPGHLIGNMVFLWLSGCMLEIGTRRWLYTLTYFFTGLCADSLFWLFNAGSIIPLIGASGAIAGLMGAFSVFFGVKKIKLFFSLGFYFNYIKAPAILLLPLWIANEFYQLFFSSETHVAYIAHIGGLISGGGISFVNRKWIQAISTEFSEEEDGEKVARLIEKALSHVEQLELEKGATLLEKAIEMEPENRTAMLHLFNVRKMHPKTPEFHAISRKLISRLILDTDDRPAVVKTFMEYKKCAGSTHLSPDIYLKLSLMLVDSGQMKQAENLLAGLLKRDPNLAGLSTAVLRLAKGYKNSGSPENHEKCMKIICRKFPGSPEATIAAKSLSQ